MFMAQGNLLPNYPRTVFYLLTGKTLQLHGGGTSSGRLFILTMSAGDLEGRP